MAGEAKRGPGRPKKWEDDAERMRASRVAERETDAQLRALLRELRSGLVPNIATDAPDAELLFQLRRMLKKMFGGTPL